MAFSGREYGDRVRELRDAGFDAFSADNGYLLRSPSQWSSGQKAAVTRAFNQLESLEESGADEFEEEPIFGGDLEGFDLDEGERDAFFADAAGDDFEEWDDIDYLDFEEVDVFDDEEGDTYAEDT